jgi:hypothetical protein
MMNSQVLLPIVLRKVYPEAFGLLQMGKAGSLLFAGGFRVRFNIPLSTTAATMPRWKASPGQVTAESTGLLPECLRLTICPLYSTFVFFPA